MALIIGSSARRFEGLRETKRQASTVLLSCSFHAGYSQSVAHLTVVLVYLQGQFDAQDGVAGTNAWIKRLDWGYLSEFEEQEGQLWYADPDSGVAAGWQRRQSTLTQVMIRNAGHMVPRDQPRAAQVMIEQWVADVLADEDWGRGLRAGDKSHMYKGASTTVQLQTGRRHQRGAVDVARH